MPTIPLYPPRPSRSHPTHSPLPTLLHTPAGLAILELQGTINFPQADSTSSATPIGRLVFPDYSPADPPEDTRWMKKVWLYVGRYQRLTGEVKRLGKPVGVLRRRKVDGSEGVTGKGATERRGDGELEEVEIAEVVEWKIIFSSRPEPVGGESGV